MSMVLKLPDFPTNTMDVADGGDFSLGTAVPGADGVLDGTAVDLCPSTEVRADNKYCQLRSCVVRRNLTGLVRLKSYISMYLLTMEI